MEQYRLNKYLSQTGYCSRRKADSLVEEGRITVNGIIATMGMQVSDEDIISIDGEPLVTKAADVKPVWMAFYKPEGIVCSLDGQGAVTVSEYLKLDKHMITVGRLDKASEGLLLITNQGQAAEKISRGRYEHEKEYEVMIDRPVTDSFVERMSGGVAILDTVTKKCRVSRISKYSFRIILTQGLNRQIRRMSEACGANVTRLKRVRICNVSLCGMKPGEIRELTDEEINGIMTEIN